MISEAVYSGRDSANVTYLGHLPVDRADAGSGPVLLTTEVYVEGEKADDTFYWFNYQRKQGCLLALPGTTLTCNVKEGHAVISNIGDVPAVGVTVECPDRDTEFVTESSLFWLNPGGGKMHCRFPYGQPGGPGLERTGSHGEMRGIENESNTILWKK